MYMYVYVYTTYVCSTYVCIINVMWNISSNIFVIIKSRRGL